MAKSLNLATLVTLAVAATLLGHSAATTYIVGDKLGWTYPPDNTTYETWASQYNFTVGDILVFNFRTGHTLARVQKAPFDSCTPYNLISYFETGPANITLDSPGEAYFFCDVADHCAAGQKLAINVKAPTSSPPTPPSSPPSIEPTPPLPVTPPPAFTPPALGPAGPAPTGSVIPPSLATTPPTLGPAGPAPTFSVVPPTPATTPPTVAPGGPGPTGPVIPLPPTSSVSPPTSPVSPPPQGSPPPSSGGNVPPTPPPPSGATRAGFASIITIFISTAACLFF